MVTIEHILAKMSSMGSDHGTNLCPKFFTYLHCVVAEIYIRFEATSSKCIHMYMYLTCIPLT